MGKGLVYMWPRFYWWGIKWFHGDQFNKRYEYMVSWVRKGDEVLEPGCGPGVFAHFLPGGVKFSGFDGNKNFVNHAKDKGLDVYVGNVLDEKSYKKCDVVIICDVIHHVAREDRTKFVKLAWKNTKRTLLICEPAGGTEEEPKGLEIIKRKIAAYMDRDGINDITEHNYFSGKELNREIVRGFGAVEKKYARVVKQIGSDIVVAYNRI